VRLLVRARLVDLLVRAGAGAGHLSVCVYLIVIPKITFGANNCHGEFCIDM
jgi:hypothetical protein